MERRLYKPNLFLLLFLSISLSVSAGIGDIQVVLSSADEFHFTVTVDAESLDRYIETDSSLTFYKSIQVGLPEGARASLLFARGSDLRPFEKTVSLSETARPLVHLLEPNRIRGRQIATVQIFPVVGSQVYGQVEVKLVFTGGLRTGEPVNDPVFDRIFKNALANYGQFISWPAAPRSLTKPSAAAAGPFAAGGEWFRVAVNQTSLYRVTGAQLSQVGVNLNGLASDDLHLYNGGGAPLPVFNEDPRPEFTEVAVYVNDGGDGSFDSDDYLLFYGESQNRWVYEAADSVYYINNVYFDRNIYWLTISDDSDGQRMILTGGPPGGGAVDSFSSHRRRIHLEQDNQLLRYNDGKITDYYSWYWSDEEQLSFFASTPGIVAGDTVEINLEGETFDLTGSGDDDGYMNIYVNDIIGLEKACNQHDCTYRSASFFDGSNKIELELWPSSAAPPHFDYIELAYECENMPINDRADLTIGAYSGVAEITVIDDFSSSPLILDISDPHRPLIHTGATVSSGQLSFYADMTGIAFNRFYLCPESKALAPLSIARATVTDLHNTNRQADCIVITDEVFENALDEFVSYRGSEGHAIMVVTVEEIMDNFAFGMFNPTAIRDYLKYAWENYPAPAPAGVLFVGDGSYDFLDRMNVNSANYVPPYIHAYDRTSSDDNYVYFGDYGLLDSDTSYTALDHGFDMIAARWPVKSTAEIAVITDKIKRYESPTDFGIWRNNITLVADDEFGNFDNETFHTTQTEELEQYHIPTYFNRDKIYMWEYPFVGTYKPEVNEAIINSINDGTLLINYVGHGNPDVWAHERVFTRDNDLPRLNNLDRLTLVFAASCAIGFFDHPANEGMAEDLLSLAIGGAVGVISATRLVYSSPNAEFNRQVFDILLYDDEVSICEAMYTAKLLRQYSGGVPAPEKNDRNYLFFGDPFLKLGVPRLDIEFTSAPDSLVALQPVSVGGRVVDDGGEVYGHDGTLFVNVYDSERQKTYRPTNGTTQTIEYSVTGPTIFRGSATIVDGAFDFQFIPPLDIGYGGEGAKISVYGMLDGIDAAGIVEAINVSDSIVAFTDTAGPTVEVSFTGRDDFTSGDVISSSEQMEISLSDPSGINLAGGLGHGITMQVDYRSEVEENLSPLFEYNQDDFTSGKIAYTLDGIEPGRHHLKIKAWDNANNSTRLEFDVEVLASDGLAIDDLLNYPNPMRESTTFSYILTRPVEKLSLEIFTLSGRKIKSFQRYSLNPGFYDDIQWYGRDSDGVRVASEVYIYKATAHLADGGEKAESFGKVVVIN